MVMHRFLLALMIRIRNRPINSECTQQIQESLVEIKIKTIPLVQPRISSVPSQQPLRLIGILIREIAQMVFRRLNNKTR